MKTTLLSSSLLAVSLVAFAQGKVTFDNDTTRLFVLGTTLPADAGLGGGTTTIGDSKGAIPISPLPSGVTLTTSLYAGTTAGSLSLQTTVSLTSPDWAAPGTMSSFAKASGEFSDAVRRGDKSEIRFNSLVLCP